MISKNESKIFIFETYMQFYSTKFFSNSGYTIFSVVITPSLTFSSLINIAMSMYLLILDNAT